MKFSYSLIKKFVPQLPPKKKVVEALNLYAYEAEDAQGDLFEVTLPHNRYSDSASHIGIAREVAAILGLKFNNPEKLIINPPRKEGIIKIEVRDPRLCPRYAARYFEIPGVGDSPKEIQKYLKSCGLKPINSIVDLMNYVMLETGQPLHAFDYDRLAKDQRKSAPDQRELTLLVVRRAKKGERIETLDNQKITLDPDVLVIADEKQPLAIAGIKGGLSSGVTKKTKRVIVEAANFDPVNIFKSTKRLKLNTDASLRFSHGLSPALAQFGLDRATELLAKSGAILKDSMDVYPQKISEKIVGFSQERFEKLIGEKINPKTAKKYFTALGFTIRPSPRADFQVHIPPLRTDIDNFEDLTEEVARLIGYNKLKSAPPVIALTLTHQEDSVIFKEKIRRILINLQLDEVYNYSFLGDADLFRTDVDQRGKSQRESALAPSEVEGLAPRESALVELENPVSADKRYLRPSLLPLLIKNIKDNSRFFSNIRIFEIGKVFGITKSGVNEKLSLGIALAEKKNSKLILELKGIADELLNSLGLTGDKIFEETKGGLRLEIDHQVIGFLHQKNLKKGWVAALAEFNAEKLLSLAEGEAEFEPLSRFPSIVRDLSILVNPDVRIGEILALIQRTSPQLVRNVDLVDEYGDEKLGGKNSLTFRIVFQKGDRTLTDKEVNKETDKISKTIRQKFKADIR